MLCELFHPTKRNSVKYLLCNRSGVGKVYIEVCHAELVSASISLQDRSRNEFGMTRFAKS